MSEFNPYELEPFWESWYIEELLGEGSYGYVYKIFKEEFGRKYYSALKIIPIPRTKSEEKQLYYEGMDQNTATEYYKEIVEVIFREICIMSELKGRTNIVSLEDHKILPKKDGAGYFLLMRMELLVNIEDYQLKNPFSVQDIVRMGMDVCRALILCGKRNIIHRDIKPGNIFVTEDGDFKLGDFGISRQLEGAGEGLSIKGTYGYMAPEVYFGKSYDTQADIYSLGMVLYYFLNKKRGPFSSSDGSVPRYSQRQEALTRRFQGERLPQPMLASEELAEVILKACEFRPEDRYLSPEEFLKALESLSAEVISDQLIEAKEEGLWKTSDNSIDKTGRKPEFDEQTIHLAAININQTEEELKSNEDASFDIEEAPQDVIAAVDKKPNRKKLIIFFSALGGMVALAVITILLWKYNNTRSKPTVESWQVKITQTPTLTLAPTVFATPTPSPTITPTAVPTIEPVIEEYELTLDQKDIDNLSMIDRIDDLTKLSAVGNQLSGVEELKQSLYLTYLDLHENRINSLVGLEKLTGLTYLDLSSNQLESIDEISGLTSIQALFISNNKISDLLPLKKLTNLQVLYLSGNRALDDLSVLRSCKKLEALTIDNTDVSDLTPLYELDGLLVLNLSNTKISKDAIAEFSNHNPNCKIIQ